MFRCRRCLNRTSVGLKPQRVPPQMGPPHPPQSNQRGIETGNISPPLGHKEGPQSNQRGIETPSSIMRTSFKCPPQSNQRGIETGIGPRDISIRPGPQSNQRGIETAKTKAAPGGGRCLNRTSVGLKPEALNAETPMAATSIEPAWD